jgi:hypothetical protein
MKCLVFVLLTSLICGKKSDSIPRSEDRNLFSINDNTEILNSHKFKSHENQDIAKQSQNNDKLEVLISTVIPTLAPAIPPTLTPAYMDLIDRNYPAHMVDKDIYQQVQSTQNDLRSKDMAANVDKIHMDLIDPPTLTPTPRPTNLDSSTNISYIVHLNYQNNENINWFYKPTSKSVYYLVHFSLSKMVCMYMNIYYICMYI